ncbi:MAG: hypothetical protein P3M75_00210 [Candidatus Hodgkinia cicadicola]|nr:MAG: hypothetical protein P3M75_00210 [Candidatus Hodgkinia cicadicola]
MPKPFRKPDELQSISTTFKPIQALAFASETPTLADLNNGFEANS